MRKRTLAFIGAIILAQCAWYLFVHRGATRAVVERPFDSTLQKRQSDRLDEWGRKTVVSFGDLGARDVLERLRCDACATDIAGTLVQDEMAILPELRHLLAASFETLVFAYARDDIDSVFRYMSDCGERPDPARVAETRATLRERGVDPATVDVLADEQVLKEWAKGADGQGIKSHWEGILDAAGCRCFWTSAVVPSPRHNPLGKDNYTVFGSERTFAHHFAPATTVSDALARDGSVLLADIRIVVCFDDALFSQPCAYYFRFWYDPNGALWHPFQMVRTAVDGDVAKQSRHLF